jgi:DNA-binding transcriptional MocR family regulator
MTRYQSLADKISALIREGVLRPNERIPSVRSARRSYDVSPATVLHAYRLLEDRGEIAARPRSGYYVCARPIQQLPQPETLEPRGSAAVVDVNELVFEVLNSIKDLSKVQLGAAFIDPSFFPLKKLARYLGQAGRRIDRNTLVEYLPPGHARLRAQIARRYLDYGCSVRPEEIIITTGALEALYLSLCAVASPGDVVVVESPAFYAQLQALELMHVKAVEIPTHPREGIVLPALAKALRQRRVKACWLMTNFQNPMGFLMAEEKKKELVNLLSRHDVPLIEDDVYEELYFGKEKPKPAKAFDKRGLVLHCSSVSKYLGPGYRVGWAAAGRFATDVERHKWMMSLATCMPAQAAISDHLIGGALNHYLRGLRQALVQQRDDMLASIARHFPKGTSATRPEGGYFLWVELPRSVDALKLHRLALEQEISIAPGPIFSVRRKFNHCIRLNFGYRWSPRSEEAIRTLGRIVGSLL